MSEVVQLCHEVGVLVHVDAAIACGHVPLDLTALGAEQPYAWAEQEQRIGGEFQT